MSVTRFHSACRDAFLRPADRVSRRQPARRPSAAPAVAAILLALVAGLTPAQAQEAPPWQGPVPDHDAQALLAAFIRADAWGLQTSSGTWPLVTRFTNWVDGPGWDTVSVVESAEIVGRRNNWRQAEITVRYRILGELHADGDMMPVLEPARKRDERVTYVLEDMGDGDARTAWKLLSPHDAPRLSVGYVMTVLLPRWCGKRDCRSTAAYRALAPRQAACAPSPIPLNRACPQHASSPPAPKKGSPP